MALITEGLAIPEVAVLFPRARRRRQQSLRPHGTPAAYRYHIRHKTKPCAKCARWHQLDMRLRRTIVQLAKLEAETGPVNPNLRRVPRTIECGRGEDHSGRPGTGLSAPPAATSLSAYQRMSQDEYAELQCEVPDGSGAVLMEGCWYCAGFRSPCTCTEDCGARPLLAGSFGHCCLEASREDVLASGVTAEAYDRRHPIPPA